ncbi:MAG: glycosyltransferase, partial [Gammaproteobacteria bacterium]|nr:glycosyltransferase [Gammaproteobacteria bacterium]
MRVSIIIAIYKDLEALQLIIDSLKRQSYTDFEVIVAEDNNSQEVSGYIKSISDLDVLHTTQKDIAIRKSRS